MISIHLIGIPLLAVAVLFWMTYRTGVGGAYSADMELQIAKQAVRQASKLAHTVAKQQISSISKSDQSPVTVADFGAQAVIISALKQAFPNDPVVGEEDAAALRADQELADKVWALAKNAAPEDKNLTEQANLFAAIDAGNFEGSPTGREWALDPIDGTKGFLRGGQYAVCLALIVNSQVELGVIGCPNLGPHGGLFSAVRGKGAFWQPLFSEGEPERINFRHLKSIEEAKFCESVESGHSALDTQLKIAKSLGITNAPVQMDSQAKYCTLAKGEADIYLRLPVRLDYEEKIWDHAAGNVLITEAGGIVTDMYGKPLDFGKGRTLRDNKGVIAAEKSIHKQVIEAVQAALA